MELLHYSSVPELISSDHKPVCAELAVRYTPKVWGESGVLSRAMQAGAQAVHDLAQRAGSAAGSAANAGGHAISEVVHSAVAHADMKPLMKASRMGTTPLLDTKSSVCAV